MTPYEHVPLHSSEASRKCRRFVDSMTQDNELNYRIARLPICFGIRIQ